MGLKIAILGTRGVPNHYGGYEQAVSFWPPHLLKKGTRLLFTIPTIILTSKKITEAFRSSTAQIPKIRSELPASLFMT